MPRLRRLTAGVAVIDAMSYATRRKIESLSLWSVSQEDVRCLEATLPNLLSLTILTTCTLSTEFTAFPRTLINLDLSCANNRNDKFYVAPNRVLDAVHSLPRLTSLALRKSNVDDVNCLAKGPASLRVLDLSASCVTSAGISQLWQCPNLEELYLTACLDVTSVASLAACPALKVLAVNRTLVESVSKVCRTTLTLRRLFVSNLNEASCDELRKAGGRIVVTLENPRAAVLERLAHVAAHITHFLLAPPSFVTPTYTSLQTMELLLKPRTEYAIDLNAIAQLSQLVKLTIRVGVPEGTSSFYHESFAAFHGSLRSAPRLRSLILMDVNCNDLVCGIDEIPTLINLTVDHSGSALSTTTTDILMRCRALVRLHIRNCTFTSTSCLDGLDQLGDLTLLDLSYCSGLTAVPSALLRCRSLKQLDWAVRPSFSLTPTDSSWLDVDLPHRIYQVKMELQLRDTKPWYANMFGEGDAC